MWSLQPSPAGAAECSPGREPRECGPSHLRSPGRGGRIICVGEALAIHKADRILVTHKGEIREDGDLGGGRGVGVTGPARRDASASGERPITGGERTTAGGERTARGGERTTRGGERTTASGEQTARGGEQTIGGGERTIGGGERTVGGGGRTTAAVARPTAAGGRTAAVVCAGFDKGGYGGVLRFGGAPWSVSYGGDTPLLASRLNPVWKSPLETGSGGAAFEKPGAEAPGRRSPSTEEPRRAGRGGLG